MNTPISMHNALRLGIALATCCYSAACAQTNPVAELAVEIYAGISVTGVLGHVYELQATTKVNDPDSWSRIAVLVLPESPQPYVYYDATSKTKSKQFYRSLDRGPLPADMALIPDNDFIMGDGYSENDAGERPTHRVHTSAFYLDKYPVTQQMWNAVKTWAIANGYNFENAGTGKAANHPVHTVSWYDCVKWCNARSQREGLIPAYYLDADLTAIYRTGRAAPYVKWEAGYRLPTEGEWEGAARGGLHGKRFPWGDAISHYQANYEAAEYRAYDLSYPAGYHPNYQSGAQPYTSPVASFLPNGYGIYDTAGNVWEWCWDWFGYYEGASQWNPRGPASGTLRVCRGGSWLTHAHGCRVAGRNSYDPTIVYNKLGFRTARAVPQ